MRWPKRAIHGPFTKLPEPEYRAGPEPSDRMIIRDRLSAAIGEGECRCQMCGEREEPKKLPKDGAGDSLWMWARAPLAGERYVSAASWPTWIMERPQWTD